MTPKKIGQAYDNITHLWESTEFDLSNGVAQHHQALSYVQSHQRALDIGCGCTNRIINLLSTQFDAVEGIDISQKMLAIAKAKRPDIPFHHADFLQWQPPHRYDFIACWDAFWHIPLNDQSEALQKMLHLLAPEGVCIFSFGGIDSPDAHVNDYMGVDMAYASLGTQGYLDVILQSGFNVVANIADQADQKHCYFIVQNKH